MKRKFFLTIMILLALVIATAIWWFARPGPVTGGSTTSGSTTAPGGTGSADQTAFEARPVTGQLENIRARLAASKDPKANRLILAELRKLLNTLPPTFASREIQAFLASAGDAATQLDVTIESGGGLGDASSLRVFLLDHLGRIDRPAAGAVATQILSRYTTPDEWAVSLRNFAWANPGPAGEAFLQAKARELLSNPGWASDPSAGFLEAFDAIVYAHGTALAPDLAAFLGNRENRAAAHAAYLTLDRLTITEPAAMLKQLVDQPALMTGSEQTRANFLARADVRDPDQRALVEQYLLDPGRGATELATFAGLYPNANFMISNNLLTTVNTPQSGQLAAHDREALKVIEQWQGDPRFARLQPLLAQIHERLGTFVRQAAGNGP
jgi:hypothetical protein